MSKQRTTPTEVKSVPNAAVLDQFFSLYKEETEEGEGKIGPSGIMKLCGDLKYDPADVAIQLFLWHCKATTLYYLSHDEFFLGCSKFKVSNVEELKEMLEKFKAGLPKFPTTKMEEFWMFIFDYNREDKLKKLLPLEDACFFLNLILVSKPHIRSIITFLKEHWKKPVSKDQWRMLLEFTNTIKLDFSNYDETQSWPGMLDDYVAWAQEKK